MSKMRNHVKNVILFLITKATIVAFVAEGLRRTFNNTSSALIQIQYLSRFIIFREKVSLYVQTTVNWNLEAISSATSKQVLRK